MTVPTTDPGGNATSGAGRRQAPSSPDRRTLVLSALVLGLVLTAGVIFVALTVDSGTRKDTQGQLQEDGGAKPHIIPLPNSGTAPKNPGDRGGWEQLMLFGLMTVGVGVIGVFALRGNRSARANRAAWRAAAQQPEP